MTIEDPVSRRPVLKGALGALVSGSALSLPGIAGSASAAAAADQPAADQQGEYRVGRGIADVTGEPAEVGMMGYARLEQRTSGIHQRQRSRAFVIAEGARDRQADGPEHRVAVVTVEVGMIFRNVRDAVLRRLAERFGSLYTERNLLITGTHTHAGPGGFSPYTLHNVTTSGFHDKTFRAMVDGIAESVERAHADLAPGSLVLTRGVLTDASVNRSRRAFERNPAADKREFPDAVDPASTLLRVERGGGPVGAINWFATHGTSLSPENTLISPDNKGYAAYRWEREVAGVDYRSGEQGFVAAFAQTNAADMSPNFALEPGTGPTDDEFTNTRLIGRRQQDVAAKLLRDPGEPVRGGVDSRSSYVDMSSVAVGPEFTGDGRQHQTCSAALGASFAAGAEDGPGPEIFHEGAGNNPFFGTLSSAAYQASPELRDCQAPKDVLLATGALGWTPKVLPIQLLRIGSLHLVALAQEVTIVAGLRLRTTVAAELGVDVADVLVAGYANDYAGYLTTPEEYDQQDYEGGHNLFGRWALPAYQQEFARLAADLRRGRPSAAGPPPSENPEGGTVALQPGVVLDSPPAGRDFGDVLEPPRPRYRAGEQVRAVFASAHPNNDLRRGGTFLEVHRREGDRWVVVADDGDWSTTYRWSRVGASASSATITWDVPPGASGEYRIVHGGDAKDASGATTPFEGVSPTFTVDSAR